MRNFRSADMRRAAKSVRGKAKKTQTAPVVVPTYVAPETTEVLEQDTDKE
jgi:hypothetical protein